MARYSCGRYPFLRFYTPFRTEQYSFRAGVFNPDDFEGDEKAAIVTVLDKMAAQPLVSEVTKDKADEVELTDCSYPGCDRIDERGFTSMAKMYGHLGQHKKEN